MIFEYTKPPFFITAAGSSGSVVRIQAAEGKT